MRDGYYLSTFIAYDSLANKMGVKLRHDQNVSLWEKSGNKISLLSYWELERITGKKQHSDTFHDKKKVDALLSHLLKEHNLSLNHINEIWGTSGLEKKKDFYHPQNLAFHSICHLFSSFFVNGSDTFNDNDIIALAADCGPDNLWEEDAFSRDFYAGAVSRKGKIEYFSISSPGHMWSHAKKRLGLREGTLMALATATPTHFIHPEKPSFIKEDITNRDLWPAMSDYVDGLVAKAKALREEDAGIVFSGFDPAFSRDENIISMVMKEVQETSNLIMKKNVEDVLARYDLDPRQTLLALSGGFCLNCPSNTFLMEEFSFKGFLAPPCINDAGLSLGQALYYFFHEGREIEIPALSPYLGQAFEDFETNEFGQFIGGVSAFNDTLFVSDVQTYPVVWFNGRAEIGPRSLGNRSLLSDPRTIEMKNILNTIKKREWWRPVAPVVLEEEMDVCFTRPRRSPFMLELFDVKENMRSRIPAVCHLDTTARLQTLAQEDNPLLHAAISAFYRDTGIPLLCNTSLNDNKEPIINTPEEALNFALRKKIPVAYINGKRFALIRHDEYSENGPRLRNTDFCTMPANEFSDVENPHRLDSDEITVFWDYKHQLGTTALQDAVKAMEIRNMVKKIKSRYGYLAR